MDFLNLLDPEVLFPALTLCASGLANLLVLLLPVPKEGGSTLYRGFYTFINWVALNVGKAKNAATSTDVAKPRRNA